MLSAIGAGGDSAYAKDTMGVTEAAEMTGRTSVRQSILLFELRLRSFMAKAMTSVKCFTAAGLLRS